SPGTRFVASEAKATVRPSADSDGATLPRSPWTPPGPTLTRSVEPAARSKTSLAPLVSSGTSVAAALAKATTPPSADRAGDDAAPPLLTRVVLPALRSRKKTFSPPAVSPATRFVARETKATAVPSAERDGLKEASAAGPPPAAGVASVVVFATRS